MDTLAPPKAKRRLYGTALRSLKLWTAYRVAAFLATTFGWPFWLSEQWRGRLQDRIDNERGGQ
jgi:hypothetical protein